MVTHSDGEGPRRWAVVQMSKQPYLVVACLPRPGEGPRKSGLKKLLSTFFFPGSKLIIACWNNHNMLTGLELKDYELRKTAIIDGERHQLRIDIAALSETRFLEIGSLDEVNYHFYWSGKPDYEPRIYGVGFAVKKSVLSSCIPLIPINERIMQHT
ncbi:unnamed protein product [Caretta caretta]